MTCRAPFLVLCLLIGLGCTSRSQGPSTAATGGASSASASGTGGAGGSGGGQRPSVCTSDRGTWDDPPPALPDDAGTYRTTLQQCWTDATCPRVMLVSHGGDWDGNNPYDSREAFVHAVQRDADGIKGDLRVTKDNIAVVTHSSPILYTESPECAGLLVEDMTADQVTCCHLIGSTTQTFQRVSDLLAWAHGRTVVMLDVKNPVDLPRAISTGIEAGAEEDLYLEVHYSDYVATVVGAPGWQRIHYVLNLAEDASPSNVQPLLAMNQTAQAFMIELAPTYAGWDAAQMNTLITQTIHPAGARAFTSTPTMNPTAADHQALFDEGFDVVMTYALSVGLPVREGVNTSRGVSPP